MIHVPCHGRKSPLWTNFPRFRAARFARLPRPETSPTAGKGISGSLLNPTWWSSKGLCRPAARPSPLSSALAGNTLSRIIPGGSAVLFAVPTGDVCAQTLSEQLFLLRRNPENWCIYLLWKIIQNSTPLPRREIPREQ